MSSSSTPGYARSYTCHTEAPQLLSKVDAFPILQIQSSYTD